MTTNNEFEHRDENEASVEYEQQASHRLQLKTILAWQRMQPEQYDQLRSTGTYQHVPEGSLARAFSIDLEAQKEAKVVLTFWGTGGYIPSEVETSHPSLLTFGIKEDEREITVEAESAYNKPRLFHTNFHLTPEGISVIEEVVFDDDDFGEIYGYPRASTPADIQRIEEITTKMTDGEIERFDDAVDHLKKWGPEGGTITESWE